MPGRGARLALGRAVSRGTRCGRDQGRQRAQRRGGAPGSGHRAPPRAGPRPRGHASPRHTRFCWCAQGKATL